MVSFVFSALVVAGSSFVSGQFGVEPPSSCSGGMDCNKDEYCNDRLCTPMGMCFSDVDCMNPANMYKDEKCVGYKYCNKDNMCQRKCGEPCPGGGPQAECTVTGCDTKIACQSSDPFSGMADCVPDFCDDCKGIFFRKNGSVEPTCTGFGEEDIDPEFGVEAPTAVDPEFGVDAPTAVDPEFGVEAPVIVDPGFGVEAPVIVDPGFGVEAPVIVDPEFGVDPPGPPQNCMENSCPIGDGGYCNDDGNCLKVGLCMADDDCFNVYNDPYPVFMCVGEIMCDRGRCVQDCDPSVGVDFGQCDKLENAMTIADYVCNDKDLTELCDYMNGNKKMKSLLSDKKGKHTLFAPVDGAIDRVPKDYLTDYTYHIVDGVATWSFDIDCTAGNNLVTMMNGKDSRTVCTKGIPDIQRGKANPDVDLLPYFLSIDDIACNGIVHKISEVLLLAKRKS